MGAFASTGHLFYNMKSDSPVKHTDQELMKQSIKNRLVTNS